MFDWKRVLVFGAHSDDEIIGLGGTIARLSKKGARVTLVTFSKGDTGYSTKNLKGKISLIREKEGKMSSEILGIDARVNLGLPTQGIVDCRETYQECVRLIRKFRPEVIFTHYYEDKHRDHRAVSHLTDEARWKASENSLPDLGRPWYTPQLFYYEVCELFLHPSIVVDITSTFKKKMAAMNVHKSQKGVLPGITEYIEGLAVVRGYMRGTKYAEAFLASNLLPQKF